MATLTPQQIAQAGIVPSYAAAAVGGDKVQPIAGSYIEVINGSGGSINVTLDSVAPSNYGTDIDVIVAVAAGARKKIPVGNAARFAGPDGLVAITYSAVTSVTVGHFYQ